MGGERHDFVQNQCATERSTYVVGKNVHTNVRRTPYFYLDSPNDLICNEERKSAPHGAGSGMFGVTREAARARSWNYVFDSINFIAWKESRMTQLKRRVFLADARRIKPLRQAFRIRNWALESQEGDLHICQINVIWRT